MNMKTKSAEEIMLAKIGKNSKIIKDMMEEYADQFKSPSPVSQQLTVSSLKRIYETYDNYLAFHEYMTFEQWLDSDKSKSALSELSVSPDAQKEIDELNREIEELNRQILAQRIEHGETKPFTVAYKRSLEKMVSQGEISYSRMIELMNEKAFHFYSEQLTSKESEISELQESAISLTQKMEFYKTGCDNFNKEMIELQTKLASKESDVKRPSEQQIEEAANIKCDSFYGEGQRDAFQDPILFFQLGAKWMRDNFMYPPPKSEAEVEEIRQRAKIFFGKAAQEGTPLGKVSFDAYPQIWEVIAKFAISEQLLLSAPSKGKYSEWISVEKTPKDRVDVLVTNGKEVQIGYYSAVGNYWSIYGNHDFKIILWQPLPEAPKSSNTNPNKK